MSRHLIVGSEAFDRSPYVHVRNVSHRRRRRPTAVAVAATAGASAIGAMGFLAYALIQTVGVFN